MLPGRVRCSLSSHLIHFALNYWEMRSLMGVKSLGPIFTPLKVTGLTPRDVRTSVWRQKNRHPMWKFTMVVEGFIVPGHSGMDTVCISYQNLSKVVLYILYRGEKCLCINWKSCCIKVLIWGPNTLVWGFFWLGLILKGNMIFFSPWTH